MLDSFSSLIGRYCSEHTCSISCTHLRAALCSVWEWVAWQMCLFLQFQQKRSWFFLSVKFYKCNSWCADLLEFFPNTQTHINIQLYHGPSQTDNIAAVWNASTKKALKGWILGTVGSTQTLSVTSTSPSITSSWERDLLAMRGDYWTGGISSSHL